jgi:hypothetical protein
MERKPKTQQELEELREENKRLREMLAELIERRIADAVEAGEQSASLGVRLPTALRNSSGSL